jgi:hypothetical protein
MKFQDINFEGKKLRFSLEPYFGDYESVRRQIESDGLRPATFREIVALVYERQKEATKRYNENEITLSMKQHPIFGYTALVPIQDKNDSSLIEHEFPKISGRNKISSSNLERRIKKSERRDLSEAYYDSITKPENKNYQEYIGDTIGRYEDYLLIPTILYKEKTTQLTSEERYPYTDDWGRDKVNVVPATYNTNKYNVFTELKYDKGRLYDSRGNLVRGVSFGIKEELKGGEENGINRR